MKTLKTKKINVVTAWNILKNLPPREFASVDEMEKTVDVIDTLAECVPDFVALLKDESELLMSKRGVVSQEEYGKMATALNAQISELELKTGKNDLKCEFEDAVFNSFFQLFEKHGKNWFTTLTDYLAFRKEMNETNQQPKDGKRNSAQKS
jgi:hypothetical protein